MKIGIYTGTIPPPIFIENLINGLADHGEKVVVYGKSFERNYEFSNSSIIIKKFPTTKYKVILFFIYYIVKLILKQPHLYLTTINICKQNSKSWAQFLTRFCRIIPPFLDDLDILHIQWAKTLYLYPEIIENIKCPVILSLRGAHINYSPLADANLCSIYKRYFPRISGFHAVSSAIAKEAEKYGAESRKISIIAPAVDNQILIPNQLIVPQNNNIKLEIISVGRCHWKKGYTTALDAMNKINIEGIQFHYTIIASGIDNENILYQIDDLNLQDNVTFINGLPHSKVLQRLKKSDLFLLSSVEEGISNAALESMALGIPVITTNCGGMSEVIQNGINGFIVPYRDAHAIAVGIMEFIKLTKDNKNKIINNALETIKQNHLLSRQISAISSIYRDYI